MNKITRNRQAYALCLLVMAIVASCSKSDESNGIGPKDKNPVELVLTGWKANDTLRNTVTAKITAEHDSGIKSIEVFADDTLIASSTTDSLSFSWNTWELVDGTYDMKVVANNNAGDRRELANKVVLNNALVRIDRSLLTGTHEKVSYFITDSVGRVVGRANYVFGGEEELITLYPSEAYSDQTINLIRVMSSSGRPSIAEYYVGMERNAYLGRFLPFSPGSSSPKNEFQPPVTVTLKNIPDYDELMVSTNVSSYQLRAGVPIIPNYELGYTTGSKVMVLLEKDGKARYNLFDIPDGSTELELDAALCELTPNTKTIRFPAAIEKGSVSVYGMVDERHTENYRFFRKAISGNTFDIFYVDELVENEQAEVVYIRDGLALTHYYYRGVPEVIDFWDVTASVANASLSNFEASITGDFGYYQVVFESNINGADTELVVFAPKGREKFQFPNIASEIDIPGFNLDAFRPVRLQLYNHDIPVDFWAHFGWTSFVLRQPGGAIARTAFLNLR